MIKKLKIKFILTNMLLLVFVLISAFAFIYVQNANLQEEKSIAAMHEVGDKPLPAPGFMGSPKSNQYSHLPIYIIETNDLSNKCYVEGFGEATALSASETQFINDLINTVNNKKSNEGIIDEYNMRYYRIPTSKGSRIVLLDKQYEDDILRQLLISFIYIGAGTLVGFLLISIFIARIAIKPIEKSINQQKQLISNVSHDIKTPLAVISTNADILLSHEENIPQEEIKWLTYIKDETHNLSEMIKMMLYLAKSDENDEKLKLSLLNLSDLAYDVALPLESICYERKKHFDILIEPNIYIKANDFALKQLFVILIDNAIKYSNENGKIVFKVDSNNDHAIVSVYNTGKPIPKDDIPHIFDRFYRVDESRTRNEGGSGLGLAIAKTIIDNNKATISVSSDESHGTIFTCTFNLAKQKNRN